MALIGALILLAGPLPEAGADFTSEKPGSESAPLLAWLTLIRPNDSPFGGYDFQAARLFRISVAHSQPSQAKIEAVIRVTSMSLKAHRFAGLGSSHLEKLEPFLHEGQWYVMVSSAGYATVELICRVSLHGREIITQSVMSLYPSMLAAFMGKTPGEPATDGPALPDWPIMEIIQGPRKSGNFKAGLPVKISVQPFTEGRLTALAKGKWQPIASGQLKDVGYKLPEDRLSDRAGLWHTQTIIIAADLGEKGRLAFTLEVSRNQALHSSKKQALTLLVTTLATSGLGLRLWRRKRSESLYVR
jgi:hypothetical protein